MWQPLARWLERRSSLATPSPELKSFFSSGPTVAGVPVDPLMAIQVPAVFSAIQVLSQDVARCPIRLRQEIADDTYEDAVDHPLWEILHDLSNPEMTSYQFKAAMEWNLLLYGRAFAEVVRVDGRVTALWPLDPERMRVDRTPDRVKRWMYAPWWTEPLGPRVLTWLFDPSQPPILELVSESPIQRCRDLIGSALALQAYIGAFFVNGAKPAGVLQLTGAHNEQTAARLRDRWASSYAGAANRGKIPVLEGGVEFKPIASSNDDAQVSEMVLAINQQIAGIFRVPTWKIGDLSKTTYSNMETGELSYVTSTLDPYFQLWEESIRRDLLTTRQYGQFTVEFDRSALIRNDLKALNDALAVGINAGYLSQNDCRKRLGLNPIPDGDTYRVNSALQPVGAPANVA